MTSARDKREAFILAQFNLIIESRGSRTQCARMLWLWWDALATHARALSSFWMCGEMSSQRGRQKEKEFIWNS